MNIDWRAFAEVFVVSFAAAVGVIMLFSIGISVLSRAPASAGPDAGLDAVPDSGVDAVTVRTRPTPVAQLTAGLCFLACALTVLYGLYVIVSK
jgi:hypothetical protein